MLLAAGELARVAVRECGEPDSLEHREPRGHGARALFRPSPAQREGDVVAGDQVRPERVVLEDHRKVAPLGRQVDGPVGDHRLADHDPA